ncbi:unnamed protein product [Nippostrongylus brasiliensis]|uniref:G protein-coupled receptor n=1 Tax=Nippostrongylus brasiliensis TaxID=27835 RepID=A0A0N4XVG5_NIPBR|nr:unnamed protein product [Nippostrongylus brasiliensis]
MPQTSLDAINYALFTLEFIVNVMFVPFALMMFYICISQKNLHVNFRTTLFLVTLGYLIMDLVRASIIVSRMCCVGLRNVAFIMASMCISMFAWLFMIIERAFASVFVRVYENRSSGCIGPMISVILVALVVIVVFNKSMYEKRHQSRIHLANRYQLDENLRAGWYLIPVAVNDVLTKAVFVLLLCYSVFFTGIPLGQDTTHLSHAYDLLSAYQRIFFALALTLRSEKFDHIMKRNKRTTKVIDQQAAAASHYFDDLKHLW